MTDVLATKGVTKSFGAVAASRDVTLTLRAGEIHALIGPNGAGKSTLISLITGALLPDQGSIWIDGTEVTPLDRVERVRKGLGRSFQISALAPELSVLENVVLGALGARGRKPSLWRPVLRDADLVGRARGSLARVGLTDRADLLATHLSHGERRLLDLAIALTLGPRAFLLDEPMAGLGAERSKFLTGLLDGLRREAPILLVEHDMDAVFALADRITVLVEGAVLATGTAADIRGNAAVRQAYLGDVA